MAFRLHDNVLNAGVDGVVDTIDGGSAEANGVIEFYSGAQPSTLGGTPSGDLLTVVDFAQPAFGDGGAGALDAGVAAALSVPLQTTGVDDNTIGFARVLDRDETVLWDDDDVGTSGNAILVNTTTVSTGVDFSVLSYTFSVAPPA